MATVLIVDDSKFSRGRVIAALEPFGYSLKEAVDGQQALDSLAMFAPDLIVTDLLMPNVDGFGLLRGLRERDLQLPVIVISADIQASSRQICTELGAAAFLNKPFQPQELIAAVQRSLSHLAAAV